MDLQDTSTKRARTGLAVVEERDVECRRDDREEALECARALREVHLDINITSAQPHTYPQHAAAQQRPQFAAGCRHDPNFYDFDKSSRLWGTANAQWRVIMNLHAWKMRSCGSSPV